MMRHLWQDFTATVREYGAVGCAFALIGIAFAIYCFGRVTTMPMASWEGRDDA